ncbi:aldo/keto reductase [Actinoallomurus sp. NPDC050550]|uniref:aldo/keto reductase n=1 Tax=Actinoallomurus sp. NPDC050550 TaxID=3154937 RepID=UPI0033F6D0B0
MNGQRLGTSAARVTRIGFGAAAIGGLYASVDAADAEAAIQAAWDGGVRYFDTAPHYGVGLSEERLGAFLRERPHTDFTVSTKVGRLLVPAEVPPPDGVDGFHGTPARTRVRDYSRDGVRRSLDDSLERLGLDRIDIALIHDPDDHVEQAIDEAYPALRELRDQGTVGAIGVGMNETAALARFVRETDLDCVLVAGRYTMLDHSAAEDLLPLCAERGVGVIAGGAFNSGLLAAPRPGMRYDYAVAPPSVLARALRMKEICERHGTPLRAAALQFTAAHQAITTVLLGARSAAEVSDGLRMAGFPVPAKLWSDLRSDGLLGGEFPVAGA